MKTVQKPEAEVKEFKDKLIKTLQDFCRSQVELWRQIPALARQADGFIGYTSGRYQMAYHCYFWPISQLDLYGLRVNLQTGELGPDRLFDVIKLGWLDSILKALDANEVINSLRSVISKASSAIIILYFPYTILLFFLVPL